MATAVIANTLPDSDAYSNYEKECISNIKGQIDVYFPNQKNLLINMTWFGPQFHNDTWLDLLELETQGSIFDNIFFLATVDPPYCNVVELQEVKNKIQALKAFYLGNFDGAHGFNFFAPILAKNFCIYKNQDIVLNNCKNIFVNYNRKPKPHRIDFVKKLVDNDLEKYGVVTLGKGDHNFYRTINEVQEDYHHSLSPDAKTFCIPMDYFTLHNLKIWKETFLYINAATEFNPVNDLFIQQDVFKPMIGLRPFVINGVQKTYRWLRLNGFKTFNHYWDHIDIEQGDVHDTIIELLHWLSKKSESELLDMYTDMLPDLEYNKKRFFEFAIEQENLANNLFKS